MKQINTRVDDQIADAFYRFCQRQRMKPSALLGAVIDFYGRSEMLAEKAESGQIGKHEMLVELGQIVADIQRLSRAPRLNLKGLENVSPAQGFPR